MGKSSKGPLIKTGVGTLSYPYLYKSDEGKEFSDGKFKTGLLLDPDSCKDIISVITDYTKECGYKMDKCSCLKKTEDGEIKLVAKSTYRPKVTDCQGNVLADSDGVYAKQTPYGGSKARMIMRLNDYGKGINAYIVGVRIIELVSGEGADFEDEDEGYVCSSVGTGSEANGNTDGQDEADADEELDF